MNGEPGLPGPMGPPGRQTEVIYTGPDGLIRPTPQKHYAFSVVRSSKLGPLKQDTTITFDSIITNVGHGFHSDSSHFLLFPLAWVLKIALDWLKFGGALASR